MQNYDHKKIIETISQVDALPSDAQAFAEWIKADAHLAFLRDNANTNEVVVYASGEYTFVHSLIVPNERLSPPDQDDLLSWNCNAYTSIASYVSGGGQEGVWLERGVTSTGTKTLQGALQLVFARGFEGWSGRGRNYLELHQEYAHVTGIHWRPEKRAYCRFNGDGDLESIVSVTNRDDKGSTMSLATFRWEPLEEYLVASNASLVRMFDFALFRKTRFSGWSNGPEQKIQDTDDFFYRRRVTGAQAAYTRGVQIVRPRRTMEAVHKAVVGESFGDQNKQYAEFIAWDWRNKQISKISTDPSASTNYFVAKDNELPYELSPAFFRPEVLSKYKTDREKYTVGERDVSCRAAWHLKGIDVNDAGQVHAYIVYLRNLPYSEQLHWLSFNEEPKTGIAQRAVTTDFKGEFSDLPNPLEKLLSIVQRWDHDGVPWWTLRDDNLVGRVNIPLTSSRDEWAESFMDLAKLVVEGFETKPIRVRLDQAQVPYIQDDKTIALLEKLLNKDGKATVKLIGLRTVQHLRSKAKGHVGGSDSDDLAQSALTDHETFANHFKHVCQLVANDLETIEKRFPT
jgi:hypothetical protein